MTVLDTVSVVGSASWSAYLIDRATGRELPLESSGWRATMTRTKNAVSDANVVLDPDYATWLNRTPRPWSDEVALRRDTDLAWIGPVTTVDDSDPEGVTWAALDRMAWAMLRRPHWRTQTYTGEVTRLFEFCLDAADFGDPSGLRRDPRPVGVVTSISPTAGDPVADSIDQLGNALEWTVVGDVVRYGLIEISAELVLPSDSWAEDRPSLRADGFQRLTHVVAVTTNNGRVWYPSADPNDRPPGSPLLVDTIDVGDLTAVQAQQVARQLYLQRQGELYVVPDDTRPININFPLNWRQMVPGAVLDSSVRGRSLFADAQPMALAGVTVEVADSVEVSVNPSLEEASPVGNGLLSTLSRFINTIPAGAGTIVPDTEVFPFNPNATDWSDFGYIDDPSGTGGGVVDDGDIPIGTWVDLDGDGIPDYYDGSGLDDPWIWDDSGGIFDDGHIGGGAGPYPTFDPFDPALPDGPLFPTAPDHYVDPFAGCPPETCCQLCGGGGGGSACTNKRIWLCTTLREADGIWYALNGDAAPLSPRFAAQTADGGLVMHANQGQPQVQFYDPNDFADITTGLLRYDIEVTCHWDYPGLSGVDSYCYFRFGDWNYRGMIVHPGFQVNPGPPLEPLYHALWNALAPLSFTDASIDTDPSTVPGLTGHVRGRMVCEIDVATGDCEVWLGRPGGTLVSQGSKNLGTGGDAGSGFEFNWQYTAAYNLPGAYALSILHSAIVTLDGIDLLRADERALNSIIPRYTPGVELRSDVYNFGRYQLIGSDFDSYFAFSPNGAPLVMSIDGTGNDDPAWEGNQPLWANGPTLVEPAIAAADRVDPGLINIFNEQPNTWFPANGNAHIVYAIADLADFDNVDDGWPRGFWPFGTKID